MFDPDKLDRAPEEFNAVDNTIAAVCFVAVVGLALGGLYLFVTNPIVQASVVGLTVAGLVGYWALKRKPTPPDLTHF